VVVRQDSDVLAEVPLEIAVVKQSRTRLMGALSLVLPFALFVLKLFGLDFESQQGRASACTPRRPGLMCAALNAGGADGVAAGVHGRAVLLAAAAAGARYSGTSRRARAASAPRPALPYPGKEIDAEGHVEPAKQAFARG